MILVVPTAIQTISPTWLTPTGTFTSGSNVLYMYHENGISRVVGWGGGVVRESTKFYTGRLCPKVQAIILLYSVMEGVPISHSLY